MKEALQGIKWGICSLTSRKKPLKGESAISTPATPEDSCRRADAAILERLARVKIWLETKQAAEEAEEAGQEEAASMLKEKADKQEAELKAEDAKAHAQGGIYRA